jgi:hypothetical protein
MKRRYFLLSGLAGVCGLVGWRYACSSDEAAIVKVLYKKLGYLKLDEAGVRQFARDLAAAKIISSSHLRITDAAGALYTHPNFSADNRFDEVVRHGEDRVVTQYLLSSDFFKNNADQMRTVRYISYYDPMVACGNPFARHVIVPTNT